MGRMRYPSEQHRWLRSRLVQVLRCHETVGFLAVGLRLAVFQMPQCKSKTALGTKSTSCLRQQTRITMVS